MSQNTIEDKIFSDFLMSLDTVDAKGRAWIGVHKANPAGGWQPGQYHEITNQVLAAGLNELALRAVSSRAPYGYIAVGTATATASLGSTWAGEVSRKAGATLTTSKMTMILVSTWGGAADSITSVALETASILNHANSGSGVPLNILTGVAATLANSDLLSIQMNFQIGSHNL